MQDEDQLAETLIDLLDGDFVTLSTDALSVTAEVLDHEREVVDAGDDERWRYEIQFMPVGEDATRVTPDRFRVAVEPDGDDGWSVSPLVAEEFVEDDLSYEPVPTDDIVDVVVLGRP